MEKIERRTIKDFFVKKGIILIFDFCKQEIVAIVNTDDGWRYHVEEQGHEGIALFTEVVNMLHFHTGIQGITRFTQILKVLHFSHRYYTLTQVFKVLQRALRYWCIKVLLFQHVFTVVYQHDHTFILDNCCTSVLFYKCIFQIIHTYPLLSVHEVATIY